MEKWKETLADRMDSWDYLKDDGHYYILVRCNGNSGVETVSKIMKEHMSSLCADYKNMWFYTGKHSFIKRNDSFAVEVGSTQAQDQLKRNLNKIVDEVEKSRQNAADETSGETVASIKRDNTLIIAIGLVLLAVLVWIIWTW